MEVNFSINLDLGKAKGIKSQSCCNCDKESNLEKWIDTAQKIIKMVKVK